jgi:hypothetical protein
MFNKLKQMINGEPELEESMLEDDVMSDEEILENQDPEQVLNDPDANYELKKLAMQMIKDRYLKPRDEDNG